MPLLLVGVQLGLCDPLHWGVSGHVQTVGSPARGLGGSRVVSRVPSLIAHTSPGSL